MKISLPRFAKNIASLLFALGLGISGVGIACGLIPLFTEGHINFEMLLISACSLPIFGFLFMWVDEGMSAKEFTGKYILLPIASVLFLVVVVAICIFLYSIASSTSATNILLFCIAILLAIIAFKK